MTIIEKNNYLLDLRETFLKNTLKDTGIAVHESGFERNIADIMYPGYRPAVAIWVESAIPTEKEIEKIKDIAEDLISRYTNKKGLSAIGINTITLSKQGDGTWAYRKEIWDIKTRFSKSEPLDELEKKILKKY